MSDMAIWTWRFINSNTHSISKLLIDVKSLFVSANPITLHRANAMKAGSPV
jgi:hypothetical protein